MADHDYTQDSFFRNIATAFYHHIWKKEKLLIRFILKPDVIPGEPLYLRREEWTTKSIAEINADGFVDCKGLHDSISWLGTRMYCRIENGQEYPIREMWPMKKDTAYTLNDAMLSNTDAQFKKSLAKANMAMAADWQKIALIGGIGIIAVVLTKYFGIW